MLEVVFLLAAEADVQGSYERFERQREGRGIRKLLMPRFDHGIFYTVEGRRIMVAAMIDLRRDPAYIQSRIGT